MSTFLRGKLNHINTLVIKCTTSVHNDINPHDPQEYQGKKPASMIDAKRIGLYAAISNELNTPNPIVHGFTRGAIRTISERETSFPLDEIEKFFFNKKFILGGWGLFS